MVVLQCPCVAWLSFSAACAVLVRCCQRFAPFRFMFSAARAVSVSVVSGLRRFGFRCFQQLALFRSCFCFLSLTLIPIGLRRHPFRCDRGLLPVLFSLSEDSPDLLSVFLPSCQSTSFLMLSKVVPQHTSVKYFFYFL